MQPTFLLNYCCSWKIYAKGDTIFYWKMYIVYNFQWFFLGNFWQLKKVNKNWKLCKSCIFYWQFFVGFVQVSFFGFHLGCVRKSYFAGKLLVNLLNVLHIKGYVGKLLYLVGVLFDHFPLLLFCWYIVFFLLFFVSSFVYFLLVCCYTALLL